MQMIRWWVISIEHDMGTLHNTEFVYIQFPIFVLYYVL